MARRYFVDITFEIEVDAEDEEQAEDIAWGWWAEGPDGDTVSQPYKVDVDETAYDTETGFPVEEE